MFEYEASPPPLHHSPSPSDQSARLSRDNTPITPVTSGFSVVKRFGKDKGLGPAGSLWFGLSDEAARPASSLHLDSTLLEPDLDDHLFDFFTSPPRDRGMAHAPPSISIPTRQSSSSPRGNQPSNLTSALRRSDSEEERVMNNAKMGLSRPIPHLAPEASSDMARFELGAQPITMKGASNDRRRESIAQSLGTGMSWGGVSVGSFIRDDMIMSGTSPFTFQSPSNHSSSYLPKLEERFMKDFSCCGLILPTLHDLLYHYENTHAQKDNNQVAATQPPLPDSRAALATNTAVHVAQQAQQRDQQQAQQLNMPGRSYTTGPQMHPGMPSRQYSSTLQTIPDMDTVEDMEMDDMDDADATTPPGNTFTQNLSPVSPQPTFSSMQPQIPQLNTNMMQGHQAYRQSAPSTPVVPSRANAFQGNNGSSTLMTNPMHQFQDFQQPYRGTPDSSAPGTPGELDEAMMAGLDDFSFQNGALFAGDFSGDMGAFSGFTGNSDMVDLCIDEPAKRLFTPGGGNQRNPQNQQQIHQKLGSGQYGANSDIAKRIREQQIAAGLPDTTTNIAPHEEPKPFRCPVIGCEKAYKNQNGLKYHKSHGHINQALHDNSDGTFSIVDPETQTPYRGTEGMEKEKPYKCPVCQKRYKNLNGLKYHSLHSPGCNPDLKQQPQQGQPQDHSSSVNAALSPVVRGQNLNIPGGSGGRPTQMAGNGSIL